MAKPLVAIETLMDQTAAAAIWPREVSDNPNFRSKSEKRKKLLGLFDEVINSLPRPDTPLAKAIGNGDISEGLAAALYESLGEFLESEPEYQSIVLYIPFELLCADIPNASNQLRQALGRFNKAYMESWKRMLAFRDARAAYVDGDIIERENRAGGVPQVIKAAHLIPWVVKSNLMGIKEAVRLLEENRDETLKESIADTFRVMADLGLISDSDIADMKKSKDCLVRNMAAIIASDKRKILCAAKKNDARFSSKNLGKRSG